MGDHELLIRIDEKLDGLQTQFDKVSNGTGFPRCVERNERLKAVEAAIKKQKDSQKWAWRSILTAGIGLVAKTLWDYWTVGVAQ